MGPGKCRLRRALLLFATVRRRNMNDYDNVEILLVEDNPHDAEMLVRALKRHNFLNKLLWVKDGAEALDFIRCAGAFADRDPEQLPKLVLLDLKMPKLGGLDVLRYIKADQKARTIPVLDGHVFERRARRRRMLRARG